MSGLERRKMKTNPRPKELKPFKGHVGKMLDMMFKGTALTEMAKQVLITHDLDVWPERELKKKMNAKELDCLTNLKFRGELPRDSLTDPTKSFKGIESVLRVSVDEIVITQKGGRRTMLNKVTRISALNNKGSIVSSQELTEIIFVKGDAMAVLPSRILKKMMKEHVERGGAIFIEKVWAK